MTQPSTAAHCIFVFIDGIGLGPANPDINPFAALSLPGLARLAGGQDWTQEALPVTSPEHVFRRIDATLGHPGLPQSGTGQATLFSGTDCIELAGRHFGPYPHSQTKGVLANQNIFHQLGHGEKDAAFANAYPSIFFEHMERRRRWTVTTYCCHEADIRLRRTEDLKRGKAVAAGITRKRWNRVGDAVRPVTPGTAARHLHALSRSNRITLFEYFLTDKVGHSQNMEDAAAVLADLDEFLSALREQIDRDQDLLIVTSDHGNLEDLSIKTHTRYPVPLLAVGAGASALSSITDIAGVVPALKEAMAPACTPQA